MDKTPPAPPATNTGGITEPDTSDEPSPLSDMPKSSETLILYDSGYRANKLE